MRSVWVVLSLFLFSASALSTSAFGLTFPYTESFTSDAAGWTGPGTSQALAHFATGGVDDGGYVAHAASNPAGNYMSAAQGGIVFRANMSANASGGAFVGNWLDGGVTRVQAYVKHDYDVAPVEFYVRVTRGAAAIFFADSAVAASDDWTLVNFEISEANYESGGGAFDFVLGGVQNFMIGARIPENLATGATPVIFSLDEVSLVPEPSSIALLLTTAMCGVSFRRRRDR